MNKPAIKTQKHLLNWRSVTIAFLICILAYPISAQEVNLSDMSLEELLNLTVTSASKKKEKASDAPSIISTITAKDIENFGGANIYEILERSPGFYGLSSYFFRKNSIGLRGNLPSHVNAEILFLINGRPFRESVFGGQNVGILTSFPVFSIKQIEIIRGPGSVLYGSNAYVGVVNIITKDGQDPYFEARAGGGSFGTKTAQLNGGTSVGDLQINGGLNYFNSEGWEFADSTRTRGPLRLFGTNTMGEDILSGNLELRYKDFTFTSFYGTNNLDHIAIVTSEPAVYKSNRLFIDLGYDTEIVENVYRLSANITYNKINDNYSNGISSQNPLSNDYVFELTNFFTLSDNLELTLGGSVYNLSGESKNESGTFAIEQYNDNWFNGYSQLDYKPTDWLKLVVGGQINKVTNTDPNFVPRIAAIASFPSGFGAKLLYGQAFRAPFATETSIFSPPILSGNENLIPETISTFETQLSYNTDKGSTAITYFHSQLNDLIGRIPNPNAGTSLIYANSTDNTSQGIELETKYNVSNSVYLEGSYSFQTNEDGNENKNVSRLPQHMLKIGGSFNIKGYTNLGVFNSYYSSPFDQPGASKGLGELSSFNWLTARLNLKLDKLIDMNGKNAGLIIEGVNLLNKKVYNPEIVLANYNAVQNKPGRAVNLSAYFKF